MLKLLWTSGSSSEMKIVAVAGEGGGFLDVLCVCGGFDFCCMHSRQSEMRSEL